MKNVRVGETVRFGVVTHHPSGAYEIAADATPKWFVFEDGVDIAIVEGEFTARTGFVGYYRASVDASLANGFESDKFYEIMASGTVAGLVGKTIVEEFVMDDVFNSNLMDVGSGNRTSAVESMVWDATVGDYVANETFGSGVLQFSDIAQIVDDVWDELASTHQTSGTFGIPYDGTNNWIDADIRNPARVAIISGVWNELITNHQVSGTFGAPFDGINSWIDSNVRERSVTDIVSGVWNELISDHNIDGTFGAQLQSIYYADIDYYHDETNTRDEYGIKWFKNNSFLTSGELTNPAMTVIDVLTGTALLSNQVLSYTNDTDALLFHIESTAANILESGNPYCIQVSGVIDSVSRTWPKIVGTHVF